MYFHGKLPYSAEDKGHMEVWVETCPLTNIWFLYYDTIRQVLDVQDRRSKINIFKGYRQWQKLQLVGQEVLNLMN